MRLRPNQKKAVTYLLLFASYVVSGKAALMLALPPGYASAIFPPAGIAVAAAFIMDRRALPWVFLGAFLLNIWIGYSPTQSIDETGLSAAIIIAVASTAQAAFGGWILRRRIGYPAAFDKAREISRFLLWSPIICLVSASLSVGGLVLLGIFDKNSAGPNWASWWVGDTLGVLVMLPIVMALAGEPRLLWKSRIKTVAFPMLIGLALFVAMFLRANQWEQYESLTDFRQISQQSLDQIKMGFGEQSALLTQLQGFIEHDFSGNITRQEFQRFSQGTVNKFPMIQAMEWVPRIAASDRDKFEADERKETPSFQITERNRAGKMQREGDRAWYYPVTYIEPMTGNEPALGFDLDSNPKRKQAVDMAVRTGQLIATEPIQLVQQGAGMLLIQSVKIKGQTMGVVLIVLKDQGFINHVLPPSSSDLNIRLLDDDAQESIYDNFPNHSSRALFVHHFEFGTRHYSLLTTPTAAYYKQHRGWQSWGVLAMGTLGTGLLGTLLLLGSGYTARVEGQVRERTSELKESEERFRYTFEHFPIGIGVGSLEGKFLRCNEAFCKILDYTKDELAHMTITDITLPGEQSSEADNKQRMLNDGAGHYRMEKRYARRDGKTIWIQVTVSLEKNASGLPDNFIIQIEDISERKQAELQLSEIKDRLEAAAAGIIGVWDWDIVNNRLVWDSVMYKLYGIREEDFSGAYEAWSATLHPEDKVRVEEELQAALRGEREYAAEFRVIWPDGSIHHLKAVSRTTFDTLGKAVRMVGVNYDLTEQKNIQFELDRMAYYDRLTKLPNRRLLEDRLAQAIILAKRENRQLALLFIDLDKFKLVNDEQGHQVGDWLLKQAAGRMMSCLRASDTLARIGGDEFIVLLPDAKDISDVVKVAEKIRSGLERSFVMDNGLQLDISSSIGVAIYPEHADNARDLIHLSDEAMYKAKKSGRNAVMYPQ